MKCVLSIKESYSKGEKKQKKSQMLMVRLGGVTPPPSTTAPHPPIVSLTRCFYIYPNFFIIIIIILCCYVSMSLTLPTPRSCERCRNCWRWNCDWNKGEPDIEFRSRFNPFPNTCQSAIFLTPVNWSPPSLGLVALVCLQS